MMSRFFPTFNVNVPMPADTAVPAAEPAGTFVWGYDMSNQTQTTTVLAEIAAERRWQINDKGWTPEHDDSHSNGELLTAGWGALARIHAPTRRSLIEAAALIVAEIERLDRTEKSV